jgi:Tol biopolymer transport system component/DNA-binding CsgD family transcriptional regulator
MGKRGRPPHPDILTPREWQVLAVLREGLTNEQIAQRLDISFATAKYHVAEIISKLGVQTREEAAAWQPEAAPDRWWQSALAWLPRRAWPIAGAAGALAAVGAVGLVWALSNGVESGAVTELTATEKPNPRPTVIYAGTSSGPTTAASVPTEGAPGEVRLSSITELLSNAGLAPADARPYQPPRNSVVLTAANGLQETEIAYGSNPVWSPDGMKLAFAGGGDGPGLGGSTEIYVMNRDGTDSHKVGKYGWADITHCLNVTWSWSQDGRFIAYSDQQPGKIYVTTSNGSHEPLFLVDGCDPAWSPAHDEIAFVVNESSSLGIYIGDPISGGIAKRLTSGVLPSWSPDGQRLAFYRHTPPRAPSLYVIDRDGTNETFIADLGVYMPYIEHAPQWSPDGALVLVPRNTQLSDLTWQHETVILGVDGSQFGVIPLSRMPSWSPDGKFIAYSDWKEQGRYTYVVSTDAIGQPLFNARGFGAVWSPDGKMIAITRYLTQ